MPHKTREFTRLFDKLRIARSSSNHHIRGFVVTDDGRKLFPPIYFNKGNKDVPEKIARKVRQNLLLTEEKFTRMLGCHIGREEYLAERLGGRSED